MRIAVIGAGFVGLTTAISLAERGHQIIVAEIDPVRREALEQGQTHFHEPGVQDALQSVPLSIVASAGEAAAVADATIICVGTPTVNGSADLTFVLSSIDEVTSAVAGTDHVILVKSTVPPGTTRSVLAPQVAGAAKVVANPEFLQEGRALADARDPSRIVIGAECPEDADAAWRIYEGQTAPRVTVDATTAELIKYASNAFLATKISFANEMATLCHAVSADWSQVTEGMGHDPRINTAFLRPGPGFGGSCFPKDVQALISSLAEHGLQSHVLAGVLARNAAQASWTIDLLERLGGPVQGKQIAILGLAFKGDTDDLRETRALPLYEALRARGAKVIGHDPRAGPAFQRMAPDIRLATSVDDALLGAHGAIVQAEHPEYRGIKTDDLGRMANPLVLDGRAALADGVGIRIGDGRGSLRAR